MFYGCLSNNSREVRQAREGCGAGFNVKPQRTQSSQRGGSASRDHESRRGRESPGGDWRGVPFRPCEQARGRKSGPAPTLRVSRPAGHETPPAAGHENDRFAVCTKRTVPHHFNTKKHQDHKGRRKALSTNPHCSQIRNANNINDITDNDIDDW